VAHIPGPCGLDVRHLPDEATLAAVEVPVRVMVGTESAPFFAEVAQWLAEANTTNVPRRANSSERELGDEKE